MGIEKTIKKIGKEFKKVVGGAIEIIEDLFKLKKIAKAVYEAFVNILNVLLVICNYILKKFNENWAIAMLLMILIQLLRIIRSIRKESRIDNMIFHIEEIRNSLVKDKK